MIDHYLDDLERELRDAAGRRVRLAVARAPQPPAGAFAGLCGVAVCVLVAVVFWQAGVARHPTAGSHPSGSTPVVPAGARALIGELGVFRRPQTAADRIEVPMPRLFTLQSVTHPPAPGPRFLTVVPSLTRLVLRMPGGRRVYLAIGRVGGSALCATTPESFMSENTKSMCRGHGVNGVAGAGANGVAGAGENGVAGGGVGAVARASQYVVVWLEVPFTKFAPGQRGGLARIGPRQTLLASPALAASAVLDPRNGGVVPEGIPDDPSTLAGAISGPKTWLEILPDRVTSARWSIQYPGHRRRVEKTLPVTNNVALLSVPQGQRDEVWSITWLTATGHAIATLHYSTAFQ